MALPVFHSAAAHSFFFDFDGTLTEIAETPAAVLVSDQTRCALHALSEATSGAVAVITGREIEAVDHFLAPVRLPVAGVHGFERRTANGARTSAATSDEDARRLELALTPLIARSPGLLLERKRGAIALHYRQRQDLEEACVSSMENAIADFRDVVLTRGKMVIEARFHRATKGTAIKEFLSEPPFAGRIPIFAGDDVTDEDAFETVNGLGGISIKIGVGQSAARLCAKDVSEFLAWLVMTAETLKGSTSREQS